SPVLGVRGRECHGLNWFVGQNLIERSPKCDLLLGGEIKHRFGFESNTTHEAQGHAEVARRLHQRLAPPSEANNPGIQHCATFSIWPSKLGYGSKIYAAAGAPGCLSG